MFDGTRKKQRISYDEQDPEFIEGMSDSDAYIYTEKKVEKKKKSKDKKKDNENWEPSPEPPKKTRIKRPLKPRKPKNPPKVGFVKTYLQNFAPAIAERTKHSIKDPIVHQDLEGHKCPFIPYKELMKNIFRPDLLFKKGCNNFNTLMPSFDPTAVNKLQFFGLEDSDSSFDYQYIKSMSDEEIDKALAETDEELEKLSDVKIDDCAVTPPFDENLKKSISIKNDVMKFDWAALGQSSKFDVILMDPPWMIQKSKSTRGVELGYQQMPDDMIAQMPLNLIQDDGYVFMWVVACKFRIGFMMLESWGYEVINTITWIKTSSRGKYKPSNGYYLQHVKETVLVACKGKGVDFMKPEEFTDVIVTPRNWRQSHKPIQLYEIIEKMFPGGRFIEVFARPHNLRNNWVSLGLELP